MTKLKICRVGIDTYKENIAYMPVGCEIAKSLGFGALSKIKIAWKNKNILATLNMTKDGPVQHGELGLSLSAFERLGAPQGSEISLTHPDPLISTEFIREKLDGKKLSKAKFVGIIEDITARRYSNIELTAFVVGCLGMGLTLNEVACLTEAMIETGETVDWGYPIVLDKHCVGGLPANRTTMVVVPIIAAFGLPIPKTSSRAITSPSGTADTMETVANVRLSLREMKKLVARENACIAWGGALSLAPSDDVIISVERPLNLDSQGQMVASILSKKRAAGATHMVLDIPIGPTAKVKNKSSAEEIKKVFQLVGKKIGLRVHAVFTDGRQPIGRGIGPLLEARDVLKVLEMAPDAPQDLLEKSCFLAGTLLEFSGKVKKGKGVALARNIVEGGRAHEKFMKIVAGQGESPRRILGSFIHEFAGPKSGTMKSIHNGKIAKVAKLAGAPEDPEAGVYLDVKLGESVKRGKKVFTVYSKSREQLDFALEFLEKNIDVITVS